MKFGEEIICLLIATVCLLSSCALGFYAGYRYRHEQGVTYRYVWVVDERRIPHGAERVRRNIHD